MSASTFTHIVSYVSVFAQAATLIALALLVRDRRSGRRDASTAWLHRNAIWLAWLVAAASMACSLIYSEIIGYAPCTLCWYQRIAMYPMALLLLIAAWMKDHRIVKYALSLCLVGGIIALDHVWLQMGGSSLIPCAANGPTCEIRFVYEFGYMTIPMMALSAFAFIAVLLGHAAELPAKHRGNA